MRNRYIALLRAINVGGSSVIKMADLKKIFEAAEMNEVTTYIQSGNVIFTSEENGIEKISLKLKQQLKKAVNYNNEIFILTPGELKSAYDGIPFEPGRNEDKQLCHIMFLSDKPGKQQVDALKKMEGEEYSFAVRGKHLYYAYPREYAGRRRNINFEKVLGVIGTDRSWKVVKKLIELAG